MSRSKKDRSRAGELTRRQFIAASAIAASAAGAVVSTPTFAFSNPANTATEVLIDPRRTIATLDRRVFGSFLEHIGRAIYGGIYQPLTPVADAEGFRKDTLELVAKLHVPIVRYPGGNFVSGYNWRDGVGPKDKRPKVHERAWNSTESNQFGVDEFLAWCDRVKTLPLLAVNLGDGTPKSAAELVEYCNGAADTTQGALRKQNGHAAPYAVQNWCLGNEMDGPWQIGHLSAVDYGKKAADAARRMRAVDKSLTLIACGSSGPSMPTYLEWDRQVLEQCYPEVDALSLHRYYDNAGETGGDSRVFVALNLLMEQQIHEVAATCDYVGSRLRSKKRLWLSFDEWNVWYRDRDGDGKRREAPPLIEEKYNLEDALLVGGLLNSLVRNADRVRVACLAQLVNVIAPILTNETSLLRQTIFYPYAWALGHARGQVLDLHVESPAYDTAKLGKTPYVDVAGTFDADSRQSCFLLLNRDLAQPRETTLRWREAAPKQVLGAEVLTGKDLKAINTFAEPERVVPQRFDVDPPGESLMLKLPPQSYTLLRLQS